MADLPDLESTRAIKQPVERMFIRSPRHATYNYGQGNTSLFYNHPRFPFEYYVNINLNYADSNTEFISKFLDGNEKDQISTLVKSIDMPAMKIDTAALNQYNRKRLSQTSVKFDPIRMVCHDVVDGKTLRFWDMYYRYYFMDGNEPGTNSPVMQEVQPSTVRTESITSSDIANMSVDELMATYQDVKSGTISSPTNTNGKKSYLENIISDTLDNHNFGFNLSTVGNARNLIHSIEIFQVHGGKFNQVTLVNPRISAFTHDNLSYSNGDKTLEVTFTIEYEYAYYTLQNMDIGGNQENNTSEMRPFLHGDFLESQTLGFTAIGPQFATTSGPGSLYESATNVGKNVQASMQTVNDAYTYGQQNVTSPSKHVVNAFAGYRPEMATGIGNPMSSISNSIKLFPKQFTHGGIISPPDLRSFIPSIPVPRVLAQFGLYKDVNRIVSSTNRVAGTLNRKINTALGNLGGGHVLK